MSAGIILVERDASRAIKFSSPDSPAASGAREKLTQPSRRFSGERGARRLASTWTIDQAREVVNTLYHSAGATAIFDDRPFERRFRDMHTASQQAQGRQAHYETIGRILFGLAPDTAMFAF